jgi:hypothetical protein
MSDKKKTTVFIASAEISEDKMDAYGLAKGDSPYEYVLKAASGSAKKSPPRIAFTEDPVSSENWAGVYKSKRRLIPDSVLKHIRIQNHLIASILRARGNTMSMFGHIKADRFDIGIDVSIKKEFEPHIRPDQIERINQRIDGFKKILLNCGHESGLKQSEKMGLATYFYIQAQNGLTFGRHATEIVYKENPLRGGEKRFDRFRPVDAGTIYLPVRRGESADAVRQSGIKLLRDQKNNIQIEIEKLEGDEYAYVQAIDNVPRMAFTSDEMIVHHLFPSTDVELQGYAPTPIDTCITAVTTHLSIDAYNRLYFQNGRAAKGILVVNSEEIDQTTLNGIKQEFMASINNVSNSFRTPILGVGNEDRVSWLPVTSSAGDGEFAFLYENVSRTIMSAFNISPDELPGLSHLSRGTAQQSLSESSNQYKLTAQRDTGLRPLILSFQSFLNNDLFKVIDPELAQLCEITISGLDAESREQESVRLQQDSALHMSYDEVLRDVDKEIVGDLMGGGVPMNERYQLTADKYVPVGAFKDHFFKDGGASVVDPLLAYPRDAFWFQNISIAMQSAPESVAALYAPRPHSLDVLKMLAQDMLDEDEN